MMLGSRAVLAAHHLVGHSILPQLAEGLHIGQSTAVRHLQAHLRSGFQQLRLSAPGKHCLFRMFEQADGLAAVQYDRPVSADEQD